MAEVGGCFWRGGAVKGAQRLGIGEGGGGDVRTGYLPTCPTEGGLGVARCMVETNIKTCQRTER